MGISTTIQKSSKLPVTVHLNAELVQSIADMKAQFQKQGRYFSVTKYIELALARSVEEAKKTLS